jgi:hypothetical protein
MWPLGHVGHVTYSFKIMQFISTGIFDDKLHPQIVSVVPNANAPLSKSLWHKLGMEKVRAGKAKKNICVFTVTRPTLFFSRQP